METPKLALLGLLGTASGNWSHHVLDGLCKIACATYSVLKEATGLCGVLSDMLEETRLFRYQHGPMTIMEFCSSLRVRALHKCCHCLCHHEWAFGVWLYGLGHSARAGWEGADHLLVRVLVWVPGEKRQNICPLLLVKILGSLTLLWEHHSSSLPP